MKRTAVYLEVFVDVYLRAFMACRGSGRASESLGEALMLAIRGPQGLDVGRGGIVLADAAGVCAAQDEAVNGQTPKRQLRRVAIHGVANRALQVSASSAREPASSHACALIARRIWGHGVTSSRAMDWRGISAWVKVREGGAGVVHVLEDGVGHLSARVLSEMDRAHALTDPTWIPRLIRVLVLEGRLELHGDGHCIQLAVLIHEEGWSFTVPVGGRFSPLLDRWEVEDGGWVSGWAVAYEGRRIEESATVTAFREGVAGCEWAERVARALNVAWCNVHNREALAVDAVELDARPIIAADPMPAMEEE